MQSTPYDLVRLLSSHENVPNEVSAENLAEIFFGSSFLVTAIQFMKEAHWLQNGNNPDSQNFPQFIQNIFQNEMLPIFYLEEFFAQTSLKQGPQILKRAEQIERETIEFVKTKPNSFQKNFAVSIFKKMDFLFRFETEMQNLKNEAGTHLGISFYRTFDLLDKIFDLDYQKQENEIFNSEQRLYAGGGVGVQSGYSTIMTALKHLRLKENDRIIDLGSGYGRVGLVTGLLYPQVNFIGYEFIPHRVDIANQACEKFNIQDRVQFLTCDLSDKNFKIPTADVYYMYDPFTDETYDLVLNQLVEISRSKKITIVTKGNARSKLEEVERLNNWPPHREFDSRNLCLFQS